MLGKSVEVMDLKGNGDILKAVWRGCLPGVILASSKKIALERMVGYVDTYIQRDIQDSVKIWHPQNFRRLVESLTKATGWESVQEELSKDCGETRSNISRHMSLLKDTNLLYELRGYAIKKERVYKQAKYFWFDSGMACFLSGIRDVNSLKRPNVKGGYVENFIFQQMLLWDSLQLMPSEIYYWKPKAGSSEVDFVVKSDNRVVGVEIKSADNLNFKDSQSMREFLKTHPEASAGIIVYAGRKVYPVATHIGAVPWTAF